MFLKGKQPAKKDAAKHTVDPQLQPWVEKYRPKTIEDVTAQEHTVAVLRKTLTSTNLPHMLFYGPPGTGKTSTILALARQLYGPDNFRTRVLELNASDERGITIVREKIKDFARQTPRANVASSDGQTYPCPPYKIIILDEADSMTQDAQAALRRIMENYARITRFCLVCNYVTRIIEPLASRCSKFRFKPLDNSSTHGRLEYIAQQEGVNISQDTIKSLIACSGGDLRRSITYLQTASRLANAQPISPRDIQEIAGVVPDVVVNDFARTLGVDTRYGPTAKADEDSMSVDASAVPDKGFMPVRKKVAALMREGYSGAQLLTQLHDVIIENDNINSKQKSKCALVFAEADKALCDGADEELWILEVALRCSKILASD
ncbi:P-loop containing nucleoside triphosphate hydrolase protein [Auricularia subglabra TFB-10046 SS5]|nr:P-loop containing nucleoside triphosphate hydrolase protein [Auricularia subglabra TFB-10046 SS5]